MDTSTYNKLKSHVIKGEEVLWMSIMRYVGYSFVLLSILFSYLFFRSQINELKELNEYCHENLLFNHSKIDFSCIFIASKNIYYTKFNLSKDDSCYGHDSCKEFYLAMLSTCLIDLEQNTQDTSYFDADFIKILQESIQVNLTMYSTSEKEEFFITKKNLFNLILSMALDYSSNIESYYANYHYIYDIMNINVCINSLFLFNDPTLVGFNENIKRKNSNISHTTESSQSTVLDSNNYYLELIMSKNILSNNIINNNLINYNNRETNNEINSDNNQIITTKDKDIQNTNDINTNNSNNKLSQEMINNNNINKKDIYGELQLKCKETLDKANIFFSETNMKALIQQYKEKNFEEEKNNSSEIINNIKNENENIISNPDKNDDIIINSKKKDINNNENKETENIIEINKKEDEIIDININDNENNKIEEEQIIIKEETKEMLRMSPTEAPIIEFLNIALSFFKGIRVCITSICSYPIITINGIIIRIGAIAPSYPGPAIR